LAFRELGQVFQLYYFTRDNFNCCGNFIYYFCPKKLYVQAKKEDVKNIMPALIALPADLC